MTTKSTLKDKICLTLAICYSFLILVLSLININDIEIVTLEASDKFYHTACYAIMAILWSYYAKLKTGSLKNNVILVLIFLISLFGIIIEVLQLTITDYRSFDWWDVLANFTGIIFGILVFKLFQKLI
jgi:VanZ family protein